MSKSNEVVLISYQFKLYHFNVQNVSSFAQFIKIQFLIEDAMNAKFSFAQDVSSK